MQCNFISLSNNKERKFLFIQGLKINVVHKDWTFPSIEFRPVGILPNIFKINKKRSRKF